LAVVHFPAARYNRRLVADEPPKSSPSSSAIVDMSEWMAVARIDECPPGTGLEVVAGDRVIALFNVDGTLHALDGVCPHQGGPLGKGCLSGAIVTCPWHGWQFDVRTGQHQLSKTLKQPSFEVRVEGELVLVKLGE
jgi:nitrite reductase/ring-hydroxylating ferredoxin subunit